MQLTHMNTPRFNSPHPSGSLRKTPPNTLNPLKKVAFGHASEPNKPSDKTHRHVNDKGHFSADTFLKTGLLLSLGNTIWLGILFASTAVGNMINPPKVSVQEELAHKDTPAQVARQQPTTSPQPGPEAHATDEDHGHEEHLEEKSSNSPDAASDGVVKTMPHGDDDHTPHTIAPHDVDENFVTALIEHMPLETANDLIREIAQTGILYGVLKAWETAKKKKAEQ